MKRSLVAMTGGAGKLGQATIPLLLKAGFRLRLIVRDASKAKKIFPAEIKQKEIELVESDLSDSRAANLLLLARACRGAGAVVNMAGLVELGASKQELYLANVASTKNMLEAARRERVPKFVHISTTGVYGTPREVPATETSPTEPVYAYGESKLEAERAVMESGIPYVVLRPSVIYGPHLSGQFEPAIRLLLSGKARIIGDGNNLLPFVHERDVARAVLLVLKSRKVVNEDFIICDDSVKLTQRKAYELVAKALGVPAPTKHASIGLAKLLAGVYAIAAKFRGKKVSVTPEFVEVLAANRVFSSAKARKFLGWKPRESVFLELPRMVRAWEKRGNLD